MTSDEDHETMLTTMNAKPLLIASLAANVLLLGGEAFLLSQIPGKPFSPRPATSHLTSVTPATVEEAVAASPTLAPAAVAEPAGTNAFDWRSVESADYHQFIAYLPVMHIRHTFFF